MSDDARILPDAIEWHEGMLLAPQHFQQLSLRNDALLHYHTTLISPFHWGIRRLSYDKVLLVSGIFRILVLEGVMPDGLMVRYEQEEQNELEIDLAARIDAVKGDPITIHLAVPMHAVGGHNGDLGRFESTESEVVDMSTGEGRVQIPRLRPRLMLVAGDHASSKYVSFPLIRAEFRDQMYILTEYVWPMLSVSVNSPIGEICSQIARRLREKALYLSDEIRTRFYVLGPSGVLDHKGKIQSLVEALPMLEAILATGLSHPYHVYLALSLVAGHIAALGMSLVPPAFAGYDHNDLRTTFTRIRDYIFAMIDEGIWESHFSIPFYYQNEAFNLEFEESWLNNPLLIGVRGVEGATERQVISWVDEALIGSESKIQSLRERRILGVARKRHEQDELYVAARGLMLFRLENDHTNIIPGQLLQVINVGDIGRMISEIVLFVQKERKQ